MDEELNNNFIEATVAQDIEKIKYYLTSPKLSIHADIDAKDNLHWTPLMYACFNNNVELVDYFLTSKELQTHANPNLLATNLGFNAFMVACFYERTEVISYLIFDYRLKPDNETLKWLKKEKNEEVLRLLQIRNMNEKINVKLDKKNIITKRKI